MRETAAPPGTVPMWGQQGEFTVKVGDMPVHIKMDGMIGICASISVWSGFSANVVEPDKPFLSETGYRKLPLFGGVAAIAAVTSYVLVPRLGLAGAALGQIITAAAQLMGSIAILMFAMRRVSPQVLV